jgi:hypothetical protein
MEHVSTPDDDKPRYNHDPEVGETHAPDPDADPHAALNTPVSEIESDAEWQRLGRRESTSDVTGMGRAQTSDTRGTDGDPVLRESDDDREARNPGQSTPFGETDAEEDALLRVEDHTGVPLTDEERNSA